MASLSEPSALPLRELDWSTNEDYLFAFDLYNATFFWEAHVYWEKLWVLETTEPAGRALLRALIQLAAASLKGKEGARKLLEKSRTSLSKLPPGRFFFGVDVESIRRRLDEGALPARLELESHVLYSPKPSRNR